MTSEELKEHIVGTHTDLVFAGRQTMNPPDYYQGMDDLRDAILEHPFFAPSPAAEGEQEKPKRPPMLLAKLDDGEWAWMQSKMWRGSMASWSFADNRAGLLKTCALTEVDEAASDPEAVRIWKAERESSPTNPTAAGPQER